MEERLARRPEAKKGLCLSTVRSEEKFNEGDLRNRNHGGLECGVARKSKLKCRIFSKKQERTGCGFGVTIDLWFSPDELEKDQSEGRFCWGPINWELRDPKEHLTYLLNEVCKAQDAVGRFKERMK